MNKFVELTEVTDGAGHYDPKSEKIYNNYFLKKIYVNPSYIICMEENEIFKKRMQKENLIPGLDPNLASFSTVTLISSGGHRKIEVIGKPNIVMAKLMEVVSGR